MDERPERLGVRSLRAMAQYRGVLATRMAGGEQERLIAEIPDAPVSESDEDVEADR